MKLLQRIVLTVLLACIFFACKTVKSLPAAATGSSRAKIVGTWTLNSVSYDGLLPGSVQIVFDQAAPNDFNGSTWKLTNSGNGSYALSNGSSQNIYWSFINNKGNDDIFQFKKLFEGDKAQKVQEGYQLIVAKNDGVNMVLKSAVSLGKGTAFIIYSFTKVK